MRRGTLTTAFLLVVALSVSVATSSAAAPPDLSQVHVHLQGVGSGLAYPTAIAWRPNDTRMYVAEQTGRVRIVTNGHASTANVINLVFPAGYGNEEGLLGLVFSADGTKIYLDYTDVNKNIHVVEWTMNGDVAQLSTRRELIVISHPVNRNHNGGQLQFGADGMLYISVGDGGGAGDVPGNAENLGSLLGKILRIDVHPSGTKQYTIPPDNPFVGVPGARPEIWMYGLRNPWKFTFDKSTRDIWIGDVGQGLYEEIDYAPSGTKGTNWGWNKVEGFHSYNGGTKPGGARDPIVELSHADGNCAVIGGYVYRGSRIANLNGVYLYADLCNGRVVATVRSGNNSVTQTRDLGLNVPQITTFAQSPIGDLFVALRTGQVYWIAPG